MFFNPQKQIKKQVKGNNIFPINNLSKINTKSTFIPHPIPNLEILANVVQRVKEEKIVDFSKTLFVGVQHTLETTATLYKSFIDTGADPKKMFFSGKCYSTNPAVALAVKKLGINLMPDAIPKKIGEYQSVCRKGIKKMWEQVEKYLKEHKEIEKIIVIDDGGRCLEEMPDYLKLAYAVGAVEQTRGGLYSEIINSIPLPLVDHATSATKWCLEAPKIGKAIFRRFDKYIENLKINQTSVCGVIGNGAIGNEIVSNLLKRGYLVLVYDKSEDAFKRFSKKNKNLVRVNSPGVVIANSEKIFTCVGDDWSKNLNILPLCKHKKKVFINCASENKDLESFLRNEILKHPNFVSPSDVLSKFSLKNSEYDIDFENGFFPVNFDREPWNVPKQDIELRQCTMYISIIQAYLCAKKPTDDGFTVNKPERLMLDPYAQRYIANLWLKRRSNQVEYKDLLSNFNDIEWIKKNSGGKYVPIPEFKKAFEKLQTTKTPDIKKLTIFFQQKHNSAPPVLQTNLILAKKIFHRRNLSF